MSISSINYLSSFTNLLGDGKTLMESFKDKNNTGALQLGHFLSKYIDTISPIMSNLNNLLSRNSDQNRSMIMNIYTYISQLSQDPNDRFDFALKAMRCSDYSPEKLYLLRGLQDSCIRSISTRFCNYPGSDYCVRDYKTRGGNEIVVTMTTCKRLELFKETVNSFLNCCTDREMVDAWIVVDDNSSPEDRLAMHKNYPFIEFIFKNEKGHPSSMNILRDRIIGKYKYNFHIEDDMRFFVKDDYLSKCIRVLDEDSRYGQCLLNRNYSEDCEGHLIYGGILKEHNDLKYYIHEFYEGKSLEEYHNNIPTISIKKSEDSQPKVINFGHVAYWPHYSLRVGMTRVSVYENVGKFNVEAPHFEREYADRYVKSGFLTTFLDSTFCQHSGKKTWENDKPNAYSMNEQPQFGKLAETSPTNPVPTNPVPTNPVPTNPAPTNPEPTDDNRPETKAMTSLIKFIDDVCSARFANESEKREINTTLIKDLLSVIDSRIKIQNPQPIITESPAESPTGPTSEEKSNLETKNVPTEKKYKAYLINLTRRKDRMDKFLDLNSDKVGNIKFSLLKATDGLTINPTHKILKAFETNDFNWKRGVIGCACSHMRIWFDILRSDLEFALVLEDDAVLCENFYEKFIHLCSQLPEKWDLVYLGFHKYSHLAYSPDLSDESKYPSLELWSKQESLKRNMGGTFGYLISKSGALNMLDIIQTNGVYNGIDWLMFKSSQAERGIGSTDTIRNISPGINDIYYCRPSIIDSDVVDLKVLDSNKKADSDIQYDDNKVYMSLDDRLKREVKFWKEKLEETNIWDHSNILSENLGNIGSKIHISDTFPKRTLLLTKINIVRFSSKEDKYDYIRRTKIYPLYYYTLEECIVSQGHPTSLHQINTCGYFIIVPETLADSEVLDKISFEGYINGNFVDSELEQFSEISSE